MQKFHTQHDPAFKLISIKRLFLDKYATHLRKYHEVHIQDTWRNYFLKNKLSLFCTFNILILKKVDFNLKHAVGIIAIIYINLSFYKLQ